jgi:hypothetical protein
VFIIIVYAVSKNITEERKEGGRKEGKRKEGEGRGKREGRKGGREGREGRKGEKSSVGEEKWERN